jgi:hypothetical protein
MIIKGDNLTIETTNLTIHQPTAVYVLMVEVMPKVAIRHVACRPCQDCQNQTDTFCLGVFETHEEMKNAFEASMAGIKHEDDDEERFIHYYEIHELGKSKRTDKHIISVWAR